MSNIEETSGDQDLLICEIRISKYLTPEGEQIIRTDPGEMAVSDVFGLLYLEARRYEAMWEH